MPPLSHDFQMAIREAKAKKSTALSLRGDKDSYWSRNVLFDIPDAVFALSELETLDLGNNQLRALPPELARLKNLKQLNVALNPLEAIPDRPGLILDSDQVQHFVEKQKAVRPEHVIGIRFRRSGLKRLEHWFSPANGPFQHLEWLDLSQCLLQTLPESITRLSHLTTLDLRNNGLQTLPETLTRLSHLTTLDLGGNALQTLPEAITRLSHLTSLHLGYNGLQTLPETLTRLSHLTTLDLRNNGLKTLPEAITRLSHLTSLDLGYNGLQTLPEAITQLSHLTTLDLRNNALQTLPEAITQLSHLTTLHLGYNGLQTLPEAITRLSHLTSLDLGYNGLQTLPEAITRLSHLTTLDLGGNALQTLPEAITQLSHLTTLHLGYNGLQTLPEAITRLSHLTVLDLRNNALQTLPEAITQLSHLTVLDLRNNALQTLPEAITRLSHLTSLDLGYNGLQTLPEAITRLSHLTTLDLGGNALQTLPEAITQLSHLTTLHLGYNGLQTLPEAITRLSHLTVLDLRNNALQTLPEAITQLSHLTVLDLRNNALQTLPEAITWLSHLTSLYFGGNALKTLPEAITRLSHLTSLYLGGNALKTLPESITRLSNLTTLYLGDNKIENPPKQVIDGGVLEIENYFEQAKKQGGTLPLYEARILIVGEAGAGKTTLKKKLLDPDYKLPEKGEDSTIGIQVENNWVFPFTKNKKIDFTAHLWDFGGQEIQYMTHQFFLRDRSLYILVADNRRQDADFDYWFKAIHLFGKGSPVLVVLNERNYKSVTNFELNYYEKLYPELEIHQFSVDLGQEKERVLKLTEAVQELTCRLKHVGDEIPKQWVPIRKTLAAREQEHHIGYKDFVAVCDTNEVKDESAARFISNYLDALGLIVHFKDDPHLYDFVVIDSQWVVEAIYAILEDKTLEHNKGRFTQAWVFELWQKKGYTYDECCKLINLIKKDSFEICFALDTGENPTFIAPQLLPSKEPEYAWPHEENLHFRFAYPFMPKGVMARLIVRLSEYIAQEHGEPLIWRRGAVIQDSGTRAEITHRDDPQSGVESIAIRVAGEDRRKKELLATVRRELKHIHKRSFSNIAVSERVPCCGTRCTTAVVPKFFEFSEIEQTIRNKRPSIYCSICNEDILIFTLLEEVVEQHVDPRKSQDELTQLLSEKLNLRIDVSPHIQVTADARAENKTDIQISIEIKNEIVNEMNGLLENLKADLLDEITDENSKTKVAKEIGKVEKAIAEVGSISTEEEAKAKTGPLSRIKKFVEKLQDGSTTAGKAIGALEDGLGYAQDLAALYNKIAPWVGMPKVPGVLLKKK